MRIALLILGVATMPGICPGQGFLMDAPGPGYRQMRGDVAPASEWVTKVHPPLTFQPGEVIQAEVLKIDDENSQIHLVFRDDSMKQVQEILEFSNQRMIRVEIGDYTLPVDFGKTFPWTGGVWLQARPDAKAKKILETLGNKPVKASLTE